MVARNGHIHQRNNRVVAARFKMDRTTGSRGAVVVEHAVGHKAETAVIVRIDRTARTGPDTVGIRSGHCVADEGRPVNEEMPVVVDRAASGHCGIIHKVGIHDRHIGAGCFIVDRTARCRCRVLFKTDIREVGNSGSQIDRTAVGRRILPEDRIRNVQLDSAMEGTAALYGTVARELGARDRDRSIGPRNKDGTAIGIGAVISKYGISDRGIANAFFHHNGTAARTAVVGRDHAVAFKGGLIHHQRTVHPHKHRAAGTPAATGFCRGVVRKSGVQDRQRAVIQRHCATGETKVIRGPAPDQLPVRRNRHAIQRQVEFIRPESGTLLTEAVFFRNICAAGQGHIFEGEGRRRGAVRIHQDHGPFRQCGGIQVHFARLCHFHIVFRYLISIGAVDHNITGEIFIHQDRGADCNGGICRPVHILGEGNCAAAEIDSAGNGFPQ